MIIIPSPLLRKYQHPALQGLKEKALTACFNAGGIQVIPENEWLFQAGETTVADILVLDGAAGLYRPQNPAEEVVQLVAGDYLPASMLQQDGRYAFNCKATQPLTILQLNLAELGQLDEETKATLHKNLQPSLTRLRMHMSGNAPAKPGPATANIEGITAYLTARSAPYLGESLLQTMLANLPKLPPYSTKLTSLMNDPKTNTRTIVEIARQDPSLTASVLRTVNSAWFGLVHKIKDFQHAVMMLGFTQMQQLLINTGVQSTMPDTPEFRQLQAHSMMISVLSHEISLSLKAGSAPLLSTLGILHDIGKSVVLLLRRQNPKQDFLLTLLDPDMVGMMLLRVWQIPENISEALQYQSWPDLLPPESIPQLHRENIAVLHLAHCSFERLRNMKAPAPAASRTRPWLACLGCRDQSLDDFLLQRLIPSINSHAKSLPLALQDLIKKAQQANHSEPAVNLDLAG